MIRKHYYVCCTDIVTYKYADKEPISDEGHIKIAQKAGEWDTLLIVQIGPFGVQPGKVMWVSESRSHSGKDESCYSEMALLDFVFNAVRVGAGSV